MTSPVGNLVVATDTFQTLVTKINVLADSLTNITVTANSNANGSLTTGNTYVNGIFSANTLAIDFSLRGGNVQSSNTLSIGSNVSVNGALIAVGGYTSSNADPSQVVDSFSISSFRSAKYLIQVNTATGFQASEILVLQDGTASYITEFAVLTSNGVLGTFSSNISSNNTQLLFSPINAVSALKFERVTIPI